MPSLLGNVPSTVIEGFQIKGHACLSYRVTSEVLYNRDRQKSDLSVATMAPSREYSPAVQRVSATCPVEDIIYLLKRDGGVFVKNAVDEHDVDQAYSEVKERLDNDVEWSGDFFPSTKASSVN